MHVRTRSNDSTEVPPTLADLGLTRALNSIEVQRYTTQDLEKEDAILANRRLLREAIAAQDWGKVQRIQAKNRAICGLR
jgi:hypothetical protein